jgi:DNA polymerase-3 subunit gamma/tau
MPQKLVGIATRMKNMTPVITEMPKVEVVVGNELIKQEMDKIHGSIVNTLKMYLHNSAIVLDVRVDEQHQEVKILSRREQFMEMVKENKAVEALRSVFDLELA